MKRLLFSVLLLLAADALHAQTTDDDKESKRKADAPTFGRWYVGGNFGLQIGNPTLINVSPIVGYRLTEKFSVGTGITYTYYKVKYQNPDYVFSTSLYGGSLFTRYQLLDNIFVQLEDEALNGEYYDPATFEIKRRWVNSVMVGGGLVQPLGTGSIMLQAMYIVNYDPEISFYPSPLVVRMGIFFY